MTGVFFILGAVGGPYGTRAKTAIATLVGGTLAISLGTLVSAIAAVMLIQDAERLMTSVSTLIEVAAIHRDNPQQMTVGILVDHALEKIASNPPISATASASPPPRPPGWRSRLWNRSPTDFGSV